MSSRISPPRVKQLFMGKRCRLCAPQVISRCKLRRDLCFHYLNGYPQVEVRYRLVVHPEALVPSEDAHGWTVLATTVRPEGCTDAELLQAYQEQLYISSSALSAVTASKRRHVPPS
jgi:hypothetical protein